LGGFDLSYFSHLSSERKNEILGIILIFLALLTLISLVSYPELNLGGPVGEYVAKILYYFLGYASFIIPLLLFFWGWNRFRNKGLEKIITRTFLLCGLVIVYSILVSTVKIPQFRNAGGYLGNQLALFLHYYFGQLGTFLITITFLFLTLLLTTGVNFQGIISALIICPLKGLTRKKISLDRPRIQISKERRKKLFPKEEKFIPSSSLAKTTSVSPEKESPLGTSLYKLPPLSLLDDLPKMNEAQNSEELQKKAEILQAKLKDFGVIGKVVAISPGPVITRYEFELAPGIKVSQIVNLADDLALAMRTSRIRIAAPVPGKSVVGVEIPNDVISIVYLKEILRSEIFQEKGSKLLMALGKTISGDPFCVNLSTMPHLLIAGATGSGKSVCINSILTSFLYRCTPEEVRFLMIDPKRLELSIYNGIPHLIFPVITEIREKRTGGRNLSEGGPYATSALRNVIMWMEARYREFAQEGVRDIEGFNQKMKLKGGKTKPYIVIVIDELADLIFATKEIEEDLARLAQMSRAVGIHLILSTQRPSVDVITGLIKANFPCRIAFQVASKVDSRTILDMNGAEKLLGRGDMLILFPGQPEPLRIHGAYISTEESQRIADFWKSQPPLRIEEESVSLTKEEEIYLEEKEGERDELFEEAKRLVVRHQQASVSLLQRRLKGRDGQGIGYARAARLIDQLEDAGIIGPYAGSKTREVLVTREELNQGGAEN